jgi:adenylate cyclase
MLSFISENEAGMADFFAELKRRNLYRVGAGYVVAAWILAQGVDLLSQVFDLPHSIAQPVILALAAGLPVTLVITWIIESKPQEKIGAAVRSRHTTVDWVLSGALALLIGLTGYQQMAQSSVVPSQSGIEAARAASAALGNAISVAVLPFANLSDDRQQEFFSDGMTEEITAALAKIPDLRVVARTSAFEFKGQNSDIQGIGQKLHATHLIEGSVRKAGTRLRITAQLIKTDDGTHIWAENYDRELTDVFAIQEEIARAIAASLRMPLGLKPGENLVANRGIDTESYEKYLRAKALIVGRGGVTAAQEIRNVTEAATLLESVIAKNPGYAPAWLRLAPTYAVLANRHVQDANIADARVLIDEFLSKAEAATQKAIQLDPNLADAYAYLAWLIRARFHPLEADEFLKRSLALDPLSSDVLWTNGMLSAAAGRLKEALAFYEQGHAVDPFYPNLARATAQFRWLNGQNEDAIELAKTLRPGDRAPLLALIFSSMGRFGEAGDALMELAAGDANAVAAQAARLLRRGPANAASPEELARLPRSLNDMLFLYLGAPERALETYERLAEVGHVSGNRADVWHPDYAPVRKTERFKTLMRKVGLVEYWRAKGWPEFCRPTAGDDFVCD